MGLANRFPPLERDRLLAAVQSYDAVDKERMNKKYEDILRLKKQQEELNSKMMIRSTIVNDILVVNRLSLVFGASFPGEVVEEPIEVINKSAMDITYKVHVICEDSDLEQLDEYVFSMRKTGGYDYNDKYMIMQSSGVKSCYRIALKVPNFKEPRQIRGKLIFFSDDFRGKLVIPICCRVDLKFKVGHYSFFSQRKTAHMSH